MHVVRLNFGLSCTLVHSTLDLFYCDSFKRSQGKKAECDIKKNWCTFLSLVQISLQQLPPGLKVFIALVKVLTGSYISLPGLTPLSLVSCACLVDGLFNQYISQQEYKPRWSQIIPKCTKGSTSAPLNSLDANSRRYSENTWQPIKCLTWLKD